MDALHMSNVSSTPFPKWKNWQVAVATLFVVAVVLIFWLLIRFSVVIFILFVSIVISTAITPLVERLHKLGMSRALGVILVYILLLAFVIAFIVLAAPLVLDQTAAFSETIPQYYEDFRSWMTRSPSLLIRRIGLELPRELPIAPAFGALPASGLPANGDNGEEAPDEEVLQQIGQVFGFAGLLARSIFTSVAVFILAFYWTLEGERILRGFLLLLPQNRREGVREMFTDIQVRVGGYIRGVVVLSLIVGSMALVAYLIIGLPYALSLALMAAIMEVVPIIGPALGILPAVLVAISLGDTQIVFMVLIAFAVIQILENTVFGPRVMKKSVGVNPILTLLALATFTSIFGIPGALLAVPIAAVFQLGLERIVRRSSQAEMEETMEEGRDILSALRVEAKELSTDVRRQIRSKDGDMSQESDELEDDIEEIAEKLDHILQNARHRRTSQ
jgi:predicted PurR-regulated permease PerM